MYEAISETGTVKDQYTTDDGKKSGVFDLATRTCQRHETNDEGKRLTGSKKEASKRHKDHQTAHHDESE